MDHPVIIIGAPRSGTNMLRDVLCRAPGFATWPCDEINLVWRHGNRAYPSDELPAALATPEVGGYIGRQFARLASHQGAPVVVEKTCANSLRVGFVDRVVPTARYLFITRDGIDTVASAMHRWHAPIDLRYTAAKVKFVPPSDLPYYGTRFVANRFKGRGAAAGAESRVESWWGPRLDGQDELRRVHTLDELCALQWQRCVDNSERDFAEIDPARVHRLSYEAFVRRPEEHVATILTFLGEPAAVDPTWVSDVSASSLGKGRASLGEETVARLTELVRPSLERYGHA